MGSRAVSLFWSSSTLQVFSYQGDKRGTDTGISAATTHTSRRDPAAPLAATEQGKAQRALLRLLLCVRLLWASGYCFCSFHRYITCSGYWRCEHTTNQWSVSPWSCFSNASFCRLRTEMLHWDGRKAKFSSPPLSLQLNLLMLNDKRRHREKEENNIIDKSCLWKKKAIMYNQAESLSWWGIQTLLHQKSQSTNTHTRSLWVSLVLIKYASTICIFLYAWRCQADLDKLPLPEFSLCLTFV